MGAISRSDWRAWLLGAVVGAVAALIVLPALWNNWFWDDSIVLERQLPAMDGIRGALAPPEGLPQWSPFYYRPVTTLSLLFDRAVWGSNAFGFHLSVLLLHVASAVCVFLLARRFFAPPGSREPAGLEPSGGGGGIAHGESHANADSPTEDTTADNTAIGPDGGSANSAGSEPEGESIPKAARLAGRPASLTTGTVAALFAGLVFALHPVHSEAAGWVSGRADILATLFCLLALLLLDVGKSRGTGPSDETTGHETTGHETDGNAAAGHATSRYSVEYSVLAGAFAFLALLSKESAIVLPFLALAVFMRRTTGGARSGAGVREVGGALNLGTGGVQDHSHGRATGSSSAWTRVVSALVAALPIMLGCAAALVVRWRVLGSLLGASARQAGDTGAAPHILGAIVHSVRRLMLPWPWTGFRMEVAAPGAADWIALLLMALLVAGSVWASRAGRAAAAFTGLALLPALGPAIFDVASSPVADRYLYLPSVGLALMMGTVAAAVLGRLNPGMRWSAAPAGGFHEQSVDAASRPVRRALLSTGAVAPAVLFIALGAETFTSVAHYRDDLTYWGAVAAAAPDDGYASLKLGQALGSAGRYAESEKAIRAAVGGNLRSSDRVIGLENLGDLALRQGRLDEARTLVEQAIKEGPGYAQAHVQMARVHRALALKELGIKAPGIAVEQPAGEAAADASGASGGDAGAVGSPVHGQADEKTPSGGREADGTDRQAETRRKALQEFNLAAQSLGKAFGIEPTNTEALLLGADIALDLGQRDHAILAIEEALRYLPVGDTRTRAEAALRSLKPGVSR